MSLLNDWMLSFNDTDISTKETTKEKKSSDEPQLEIISLNSITDNSQNSQLSSSFFEHRYEPQVLNKNESAKSMQFARVIGDPNTGALYKRRREIENMVPDAAVQNFPLQGKSHISHSEIVQCMTEKKLDPEHLKYGVSSTIHQEFKPLQALGTAAEIYKQLPGATITMETTRKLIATQPWVIQAESWYQVCPINRKVAFSCVAFFETGRTDLDPKELRSVMAISVGDSIYFASCLACDPYLAPDHQISRAVGNIGKPGLSLLIPPFLCRVRPVQTNEWKLVNHDDFDFHPEDNFTSTSLHLTLTEYRVPYALNHEGIRDIQTFFQEAAVSIYDGPTWVGDVDIMGLLNAREHSNPQILQRSCPHNFHDPEILPFGESPSIQPRKINSIANWHELLDAPKHAAVVKANGNWVGRLAATALCHRQGHTIIILPPDHCPNKCFEDPNFRKKLVAYFNFSDITHTRLFLYTDICMWTKDVSS